MTEHYKIEATSVFKLSQQRLFTFLSKNYSQALAIKNKKKLKEYITSRLETTPFAAPVSERMLSMGLSEYRQLHVPEHNIVIYTVNEHVKLVTLILVSDARQSIRKLLYDINILM